MRKTRKKRNIFLLFVVAVLLTLGVVAIPNFYKQVQTNENEEKQPEKEKDVPKLKIVDLNSKSRPVAVMINNIDVARTVQSGLQDAYMVYEIIVEGGLTRMMAVFKDANTERIGSIRSSRHYFLDYAMENDAVYVHWGYSDAAKADIADYHIQNINGLMYGNKYFWKDNTLSISTEHRAFTSMDKIKQGISGLGYRNTTDARPLLSYSVDNIDVSKMEGAIPANNVKIKYSGSVNTSYVYDSTNGNYKRSVNNKAHVDYVTKKQYTTKNIITYKVKNSLRKGDIKGRQDLDNVGSGTGYYISNGYAVPITWAKSSRSAKTIYKLKDGTELKVNDGNTFIQIQPVDGDLAIS